MSVTILVVDDSMMVRKQVGTALRGADYLVLEAADGVEALELLEANPGVAMVVCDVNMPRMNGLEFLERLGSRTVQLPVVMLTTEGQPALMQRAKQLGAKGWIQKPFKPEFLTATAKKLAVGA